VRAVPPPGGSRLAPFYARADVADSYAVALPAGAPGLDALAERALGDPAPWVGTAMAVRDRVMGGLGVKTSADLRDALVRRGADRIDFFPVLSREAREIVLGADDRHLDFRLSLLLSPDRGGRETLTATTLVRFRSGLGRLYLAAILPGHRLVVRSALRRAASLHPAPAPPQ
jgi:hypothetical protein